MSGFSFQSEQIMKINLRIFSNQLFKVNSFDNSKLEPQIGDTCEEHLSETQNFYLDSYFYPDQYDIEI